MRWRWIFIIAFALILALAAGGYLYVSTYDFNRLRPVIAENFQEVTGRSLQIGGDIRIKIGLAPAITLEHISIQNAAWGTRPEMVKVRVLEAQIALLPLLRKKLELRRLVLLEPDILIERSKDGRLNWGLKRQERGEGQEPITGAQKGLTKRSLFLFKQIFLKKGSIAFKDHATGKSHRVIIKEFSARTRDGLSPIEVYLDGSYNKRGLKIEGSTGPLLNLLDPLRPWGINLAVTLGDNSILLDGSIMDVVRLKGLKVSVALSGTSIRHAGTIAGFSRVPDLGPFTGHFLISNTSGSLAIRDLNMKIGKRGGLGIEIRGKIHDPLARRGLSIHFLLQGASISALKRTFGVPVVPFKGPFAIQGDLADQSPGGYRLTNLRARFGKNDLRGRLKIAVSKKRLSVTGKLSSRFFDLRPFYPGKTSRIKAQDKASRAGKRKSVFSANPLPFPDLKNTHLDLKIAAKRLLLRRIALVDLNSDLKIKDGRVTVKYLRSSFAGGGSLTLSFDSGPTGKARSYTLSLSLVQLDIKDMFKELGIAEPLEGKLEIDMDIFGRGVSLAEIMADLNGQISLTVDKGRFDNKFLNRLGTDFATTALRLLNPLGGEKKYSEINCFVGHFDINDGIARSKVFVLDTEYMSFIGSGDIDLGTEGLDFSVKPIPKGGLGIKGLGRLSISMGELAKPLKLAGTLADPSLEVDPKQTAILLGKALGGIALFGPFGIAAVLAGGSLGDKNPCIAALEAIEKAWSRNQKSAEHARKAQSGEDGRKGTKDSIKKVFRDIGRSFKSLFKR